MLFQSFPASVPSAAQAGLLLWAQIVNLGITPCAGDEGLMTGRWQGEKGSRLLCS